MTCGGCSSRIEKVIGALDGVKSCNVSAAMGIGIFAVDEAKLSAEELCSRIQNMGFNANIQGEYPRLIYDEISGNQQHASDDSCCPNSVNLLLGPPGEVTESKLSILRGVAEDMGATLVIRNADSRNLSRVGAAYIATVEFDAAAIGGRDLLERLQAVPGLTVSFVPVLEGTMEEHSLLLETVRIASIKCSIIAGVMMLLQWHQEFLFAVLAGFSGFVWMALSVPVVFVWTRFIVAKARLGYINMELFVVVNSWMCFAIATFLLAIDCVRVVTGNSINSGELTYMLGVASAGLSSAPAYFKTATMLVTIHTIGRVRVV